MKIFIVLKLRKKMLWPKKITLSIPLAYKNPLGVAIRERILFENEKRKSKSNWYTQSDNFSYFQWFLSFLILIMDEFSSELLAKISWWFGRKFGSRYTHVALRWFFSPKFDQIPYFNDKHDWGNDKQNKRIPFWYRLILTQITVQWVLLS